MGRFVEFLKQKIRETNDEKYWADREDQFRRAAAGEKNVIQGQEPVSKYPGLEPTVPLRKSLGLEGLRSGSVVPPDLVSQIPDDDIAPSWYTATKYYRDKKNRVIKK